MTPVRRSVDHCGIDWIRQSQLPSNIELAARNWDLEVQTGEKQ